MPDSTGAACVDITWFQALPMQVASANICAYAKQLRKAPQPKYHCSPPSRTLECQIDLYKKKVAQMAVKWCPGLVSAWTIALGELAKLGFLMVFFAVALNITPQSHKTWPWDILRYHVLKKCCSPCVSGPNIAPGPMAASHQRPQWSAAKGFQELQPHPCQHAATVSSNALNFERNHGTFHG